MTERPYGAGQLVASRPDKQMLCQTTLFADVQACLTPAAITNALCLGGGSNSMCLRSACILTAVVCPLQMLLYANRLIRSVNLHDLPEIQS